MDVAPLRPLTSHQDDQDLRNLPKFQESEIPMVNFCLEHFLGISERIGVYIYIYGNTLEIYLHIYIYTTKKSIAMKFAKNDSTKTWVIKKGNFK